jgi:hypothetical protein
VKIYLVESDSSDRTVAILNKISDCRENFNYISLGSLKSKIPDRIARIRFCRNRYVEEIRGINQELNTDFIVVADLDGMNSRISKKGFNSSFHRDDWSVTLANQLGGYYDLLALRHEKWCPMDVMDELKSEQLKIDKADLPLYSIFRRLKRRMRFDQARKRAIYSKMKVIPWFADWIEVESGFGGLGIYQTEIFLNFDYSLSTSDKLNESEHVALSTRIRGDGGRIFINPRMVNNYFNTYNVNRYFLVRQFREIYWNSQKKFSRSR